MKPTENPGSNMGSLTNNVHPLLARDKFAKSVNYAKVFLQPARLATRMLATPQAEHYFLALITKSKHVSSLRGAAKDRRNRFWSDKDIGKLEELDRQCVDTWLRKVAEAITYSVRICDNGALAEIKKIPYDSSKTDLGHCIICISRREHYDPLRGDDLSPTERIIRQFNLAIALLHELAHAVSYAITARQDEDFFEDAIVAEAGFEFEARLFGACPSYSANAPKLVQWFPWPSRILLGGEGEVESYDLADLCSSARKLEDGGPMSRVSVRFMKDLFQEQFWEKAMQGTGAAVALLAPDVRRSAPKMKSIRDLLAMADEQKARWKKRMCGKRRRSVRLHGCACQRLRSRCRCLRR
jgi:hypothetical protein